MISVSWLEIKYMISVSWLEIKHMISVYSLLIIPYYDNMTGQDILSSTTNNLKLIMNFDFSR